MEEAYRFIINEILDGNIKTKRDLEKVKLKACRDFKLKKFMSNSELLENATTTERIKIVPILRKKPTRTISGVAIVAVMCKPHKCPHGRCTYCPESDIAPPSYTGEEPAALRARMYDFDPYKQTYNRLLQLESIGHPLDKVELIIMGGTFPSYNICYQEWFVTKCLEAMNNFGLNQNNVTIHRNGGELNIPKGFRYLKDVQVENEQSAVRCVGTTFETRPDYAKIEDIDRMLNMGVTRVELGVQTIYNFIYRRIERGHTVKDVIESSRMLRDSGIKVAMHLMPGLFSDQKRDMRIFHRIFEDENFKPDMLKIYPCLVTKGSKLYELWQNGEYTPYTSEEAADLIYNVKKMLPKWVRTMRIQRDIPSQLIMAGVKKSNLGELVYQKLEEHNVNCQCIRCREVGHRVALGIKPNFSNVKLMKEEYTAGNGREIFLSQEDPSTDTLIGFLRLRIPSETAHRVEIDTKTAIVRELHVYGQMAEIGQKREELWQHSGYGEELLFEAEKVASEEFDKNKLVIISGVGARNYYRKFGYEIDGPYMSKMIK